MKAFVTVTAAQGTFLKVRHSIQNALFGSKIHITNCQDVIGFCDVILEISFEGNKKEFFDEVISVINRNEDVNAIRTFIAYDSCDKSDKAQALTGYLFIAVVPSQIKHVKKELCKLPEINSTSIVAGEFEIIATMTCPITEIPEFYQRLVIAGIKRTVTCLPLDILRTLKKETRSILPQSYRENQDVKQEEQLGPQIQST